MSINDARLRDANHRPIRPAGRYVLLWLHGARRLSANHALDVAVARASELQRPLVVYEELRSDEPWASARFHQFILEGMRDNAARAAMLGLTYWPFVETSLQSARGLLARLSAEACCVVTDDVPCSTSPTQTDALAARATCAVFAVDTNCIVPLSLLGAPVSAASHLRPRLHRLFLDSWLARASEIPQLSPPVTTYVGAPFRQADLSVLDTLLAGIRFPRSIPPVSRTPGGGTAAHTKLESFITSRLGGYAEHRSHTLPPDESFASGLSPYLHHGHISDQEIVERIFARLDWTPNDLNPDVRGKREGYFCRDANVNAFLDELLTWRGVSFQWHWSRHVDTTSLERALPSWALATLALHTQDPRPYTYTREQLERGETHDPLWNAAQRELVATGSMHNYLRMLWGKKVLEWSATPTGAYETLVELNNRYALDGRDPNSWGGILWCFGLFDRPWPERPIFGKVRCMTSESTARKYDLRRYLAYANTLPAFGR